jgi:hypothetical protein
LLASSCATLGPKSPVEVYYRSDLATVTGKVIVFPVMSFDGKKATGARGVEMALLSKWSGLYGVANIISAGPAAEKLSGSAGFTALIGSLDNTSAVEQIHQNPQISDALAAIASLLGRNNLGFALIEGGEREFDSGGTVYLSVGFFDVRNLTWKWITKTSAKKGPMGRWELSSSEMVGKSFKEIEAKRAEAPDPEPQGGTQGGGEEMPPAAPVPQSVSAAPDPGTEVRRLISMLDSRDWQVRRKAAFELGGIRAKGAVERLLDLLEDENNQVCGVSAMALGRIGDKRAFSPLMEKLEDASAYVRTSAAKALGSLGDKRAMAALKARLTDPSPNVRKAAVAARKKLRAPPSAQLPVDQ